MGSGPGLSGSPARGAMGLAPKLCQVGQGQRVSRGGGVIPVPGAVWTMWSLMLSHRGDPRECLPQSPCPWLLVDGAAPAMALRSRGHRHRRTLEPQGSPPGRRAVRPRSGGGGEGAAQWSHRLSGSEGEGNLMWWVKQVMEGIQG